MSITAVAPLPCNELAACNCLVGCPRSTLVSDLTSTSSVDAAHAALTGSPQTMLCITTGEAMWWVDTV
jgi:hypothetical protein